MPKSKRAIAMLILLCLVFTFVISEIFIISHANHDCIGEECPVCVIVHNFGNTLKKFFSIAMICRIALLITITFLIYTILFSSGTIKNTLNSMKIRLNN